MCHHHDCDCERHFHHAPSRVWHHGDCRCDPGYAPRHFPTRQEIVEDLEEYATQLKAEVKGVEERIAELKKED